ncbi:MAG: ABC transporter permease [Candidatus Nanopelagicales bacterium]|nr:ABC transporter permease [Candidatus Nanopelagicales bacterium]
MISAAQTPPLSPPGALALGRLRIAVELKQFFRDRDSAIWNFLLPVLLLVIFGSIFGGQDLGPGIDVTFSQYFVAGMIASGVVYTSFQNLAIAIPIEREAGALKRLSGTPMPKLSYFIGKIATVFLIYVGQVILLLIVGIVFFKLHLPTTGTQWLTFAWVSVLGLITCTLCGLAFSSVPKTAKGASAIVAPIVLVLQFASGVFIQFSELPTWMQNVASIFPLKWLTQGMRSVFLPSEAQSLEVAGAWELGRVALALGIWSVLGLVLALIFFRWQLRKDE